MHLWAIRAVFGGVRNLQLKIEGFSWPERHVNHLELSPTWWIWLLIWNDTRTWKRGISVRTEESSRVKDSYSVRTSRFPGVISWCSIASAQRSPFRRYRWKRCPKRWWHTLDVLPGVNEPFKGCRETMRSSRSIAVLETDSSEFKY